MAKSMGAGDRAHSCDFKSKCFTVRSPSPTTQLQGQKLKLEHGLLSAYLRSPLSEPLPSSSQHSLNPRCLTQAWWWGGAVSRRLLPSQKSALTSWGKVHAAPAAATAKLRQGVPRAEKLRCGAPSIPGPMRHEEPCNSSHLQCAHHQFWVY